MGFKTLWSWVAWGSNQVTLDYLRLGHGGIVPIVKDAQCMEHVLGLQGMKIFYCLP